MLVNTLKKAFIISAVAIILTFDYTFCMDFPSDPKEEPSSQTDFFHMDKDKESNELYLQILEELKPQTLEQNKETFQEYRHRFESLITSSDTNINKIAEMLFIEIVVAAIYNAEHARQNSYYRSMPPNSFISNEIVVGNFDFLHELMQFRVTIAGKKVDLFLDFEAEQGSTEIQQEEVFADDENKDSVVPKNSQ